MINKKDNTQENDNTIKTTYNKEIIRINKPLCCPYCNNETMKDDDFHINKFCCVNINDCNAYNKVCNSENVKNGRFLGILSNDKKTLNNLMQDSIKESENETIKEEIEQANDNINLLFLSKPKSKKAQSEINKLIEGLI
jgi:hypothetical protein